MYADLILPLPLQNLFTYEVPQSMVGLVRRGCRALVQFGKKKYYSGIIVEVHDRKPDYETKSICEVVDTEPVVTEGQFRLWKWMAEYYICTLGEVMKAAMPQGLKLESESRLMYNAMFDGRDELTPRQAEVLDIVCQKKACTISDVASALGGVNPMSHIRALLEAEAIYISEELRDAYKPKTINTFGLSPELRAEDDVYAALGELERRAPRQMEALMAFMQAAGGAGQATSGRRLTKEQIEAGGKISAAALADLVKKGILTQEKTAVSRLDGSQGAAFAINELTEIQAKALHEIKEQGEGGKPVLLYGVTGSGKTEVYIHLISEAIAAGRNVLYLLPEIALTTQITERLSRHFGSEMVVYHSKFSDAERVEVWKKLLSSQPPRLVLGVRSSVLLPLTNLGLVIVDEEHEGSFKQYDPAPRYNARDMAIVLAGQMGGGCRIVLGSATPSLESWDNARRRKYGLVRLERRHAGLELPEVETIDMTSARRRKAVSGIFSFRLKEVIGNALKGGEQLILFQNRRGFSPIVECRQCAMVPKCVNCDVSLTYHKKTGQLVCHYCGYAISMPPVCPVCGTPSLTPEGFGTEKVEEECAEQFPQARVARMDLDTARSRRAFEELIMQFAARKYDILIGTQMVTKGLDFEGVTTVGVMNADALVNMPDFRADERAYQLMAQVSGRAGRKGSRGKVYIQTSKPDHPVIVAVCTNDYEGNAERLLAEREAYFFPPFARMISLTIKHREAETALDAARGLALALQAKFGRMVTGPVQPAVARVSNLFMQEIVLRIPKTTNPSQVKSLMMADVNGMLADMRFRSVVVRIDVDPY